MPKRALICGISGQDGSYLAQLLLAKDYQVTGTSRDAQIAPFENLSRLGIRDRVEVFSMVLTDFRSTLQVLAKVQPNEVYIMYSAGNPAKAQRLLGWRAQSTMRDVVRRMIEAELHHRSEKI